MLMVKGPPPLDEATLDAFYEIVMSDLPRRLARRAALRQERRRCAS